MDAEADEVPADLDVRLETFLERLTPSLGRPDRRRQARTYVAGLLLDGERKSVQPLAGRLGATDNGQALHHFIAHSPWAHEGLFVAMAQEAARLWPRPHAWIIAETSFPKAGRHSVGVGHQYGGALGKLANCQVAVSLHSAAHPAEQAGSAALGWRLFLPREWIADPARRQKAGIPAEATYRSKNTLALQLIDEALARRLPPAPVLADSDYGDDDSWRAALRARQVGYCVAVEPRAKAWTSAPVGSPLLPPVGPRPSTRCPPPNAWTRSRASGRPRPGASSPGGTGPVAACKAALRGSPSGPATVTPSASTRPDAPTSGCSSSGPRTKRPRPTTGSPTWVVSREHRPSNAWWAWRGNAGASSRTTGS